MKNKTNQIERITKMTVRELRSLLFSLAQDDEVVIVTSGDLGIGGSVTRTRSIVPRSIINMANGESFPALGHRDDDLGFVSIVTN